MIGKSITARVYKPAGEGNYTFIKEWPEFQFDGFEKTINGGLGECILRLPLSFAYDGIDLQLMNQVELIISDTETMSRASSEDISGRTIYRGYISLIERDLSDSADSVTIHLLGYYTLFHVGIFKDASTVLMTSKTGAPPYISQFGSGVYGDADVGGMVRDLIDQYENENDWPKFTWDGDSIPLTGNEVSIQFKLNTYREALDTLKSLAPTGVYWYVDENLHVYFRAIPAEPVHTFTAGKDTVRVHVENSIENVRNFVLIGHSVTGTPALKHYEDVSSGSDYGIRMHRSSDASYGAESAADAAGARFIAERKDPSVRIIIEIADSNNALGKGYDIETINPGDTCRLQGFSSDLPHIFQDNMVITSVQYRLESVRLEVEPVKSGLLDIQNKQGEDIQKLSGIFQDTSYT